MTERRASPKHHDAAQCAQPLIGETADRCQRIMRVTEQRGGKLLLAQIGEESRIGQECAACFGDLLDSRLDLLAAPLVDAHIRHENEEPERIGDDAADLRDDGSG